MSPDARSLDGDDKLPAARPLEPRLCPACGRPNACARAAGTDAAHCWCFALSLAPEVLQRVRRKFPATACLCCGCLERERAAVPSAGL